MAAVPSGPAVMPSSKVTVTVSKLAELTALASCGATASALTVMVATRLVAFWAPSVSTA